MDKGKKKESIIQDKEVLLYKPYNILTSISSKTLPPDIQML